MSLLRRLTLVVAVAIVTLSCGAPTETDLVGTWVLLDSSRERLREEYGQAVEAQLALASDGSFAAIELPIGQRLYADDPVAYQGAAGRGVLIDGRGYWSIADVGSLNVRLALDETVKDYRIHLPDAAHFSIHRRGLRGYRLLYFGLTPDTLPIYFDRVTTEEAGAK